MGRWRHDVASGTYEVPLAGGGVQIVEWGQSDIYYEPDPGEVVPFPTWSHSQIIGRPPRAALEESRPALSGPVLSCGQKVRPMDLRPAESIV